MVLATDEVRTRVVRALEEYLELADRMRRLEETFSVQVLHTAAQLHETIARRRQLEAAYDRIRRKLDRGEYASTAALQDDVRSALILVETEHPDGEAAGVPADGAADSGAGLDAVDELDEPLDAATKDRILREFKRVVLPNVHSDTSNEPYASFDVAYSAYRASDYPLMEAFVIRYRPALSAEEARSRLGEYHAAERRLDRRLYALRRAATSAELDDSEEARQRIVRQSEEFRRAIDEEAERLEAVRSALQALLNEHEVVA